MSKILLVAALAAASCAHGPQVHTTGKRPNIVVVIVDDLRWDALSITGHPFVKTPHIDRIAREGALFKNAFVTTPLCSPSRASFWTGTYVHQHKIIGNTENGPQSHMLITYPALLQKSGYETAYVGKWHMGTDPTPRPGFDRWVSFKGQGVYNDPALHIDGEPTPTKGYITDVLSEHAAQFIEKDRQKPFALVLAHKAVHGPFTPAERHKDLFTDETIPRAASADDDRQGKPALTFGQPEGAEAKAAAPKGNNTARNQLRCLMAIEDGMGRLLQALEKKGILDDTIVIFTSDNGYFWGEHGGLGDKRWAYEESIRIPMFLRYPKLVAGGTKIDGMVQNIDLAPTFLDLAGVSSPRPLPGRSLVPILRGQTEGWRSSAFFEYFAEKAYPRVPNWQAIRTDRWKYIHYQDQEGLDELYDLQADGLELKNLVQDPAAASALATLKDELGKTLAKTR